MFAPAPGIVEKVMTMNYTRCFSRAFLCLSAGLLLVLSLMSQSVLASISIQPAFLKVELNDKNPSGSFVVTNQSKEAQRFRAKALHFQLSRSGSISPTQADEYSLAKWVKFNPKEFTLPPNSSRKIRFSIIKKHSGKPREYWGAIEFTPLTDVKYSAENEKKKMQFRIVTKILVPIYGAMEGIEYAASLSDVQAAKDKQKTRLSVVIENNGDGILRLYGDGKLVDKNTGETLLNVPIKKVVVLPRQSRKLDVFAPEQVGAGEYQTVFSLKEKVSGMSLDKTEAVIFN